MGERSKPPKKDITPAPAPEPPEDHDVVLLTGSRTEDGEGVHALRARPNKLELAEIRPLKEGKPLNEGELISLHAREESPALYDVKVEYAKGKEHAGPVRVTTSSYRQGWEAIFSKKKSRKKKQKPKVLN